METKNAQISHTMLGYEDHGILTAMIYLNYGGSGQGFGGYSLDRYSKERECRIEDKACGFFIRRILEVVGVSKWEELASKYIRVKADSSKVYAIGNLLEDKWFNPAEEFATND